MKKGEYVPEPHAPLWSSFVTHEKSSPHVNADAITCRLVSISHVPMYADATNTHSTKL